MSEVPFSESVKTFRQHTIPALVAAVMLLVAISPAWPGSSDYFTLLRWAVCGCAVYLTYRAWATEDGRHAVAPIIIAILWNPIIPVCLDRPTWQVLDFLGAGTMFGYAGLTYPNQDRLERERQEQEPDDYATSASAAPTPAPRS